MSSIHPYFYECSTCKGRRINLLTTRRALHLASAVTSFLSLKPISIHAQRHGGRGRPRGGGPTQGHLSPPLPSDPGRSHQHDSEYLKAIEENIAASKEVLIIGHGKGKGQAAEILLKDLANKKDLLNKVKGVFKVDDSHLTDKQILAMARKVMLKRPDPRKKRSISGQPPFGE